MCYISCPVCVVKSTAPGDIEPVKGFHGSANDEALLVHEKAALSGIVTESTQTLLGRSAHKLVMCVTIALSTDLSLLTGPFLMPRHERYL
jgi:hypothetical protein